MTPLERLSELGKAIAKEQDGWLSTMPKSQGREEFLRKGSEVLSRRAQSGQRLPRRMVAAFAAAAVLGTSVLALEVVRSGEEPLSVSLHGVELPAPTAKWWAVAESPLPFEFSDGSRVLFDAGSRGRITRVTPKGAEVLLESGQARVHVEPKKGANWRFILGPYTVEVLGTEFEVTWHPEEDTFEFTLHKGRVHISGCAFGEGRPVLAGEKVKAFCRAERVETLLGRSEPAVEEGSTIPLTASPNEAAQALVASKPEEVPKKPAWEPESGVHRSETTTDVGKPQPAHQLGRAEASPNWRTLAKEHDYAGALREAEAEGFSKQCESLNAEDLLLLGDVARLASNGGRAVQAYQAIRTRFEGSPESSLAAFKLAKVTSDSQGDDAASLRWLEVYLTESPSGGLAREALGRLMEVQNRLGKVRDAQATARRYLAEYPFGPAAPLARDLAAR